MSFMQLQPETFGPGASDVDGDAVASVGRISLPASCGTTAADELRTALVLAADFAPATTIDAAGVENIGQAVLQLLVAARHEAMRDGRNFAIVDASPAFVERVTGCRLADAVGLVVETGEVS